MPVLVVFLMASKATEYRCALPDVESVGGGKQPAPSRTATIDVGTLTGAAQPCMALEPLDTT